MQRNKQLSFSTEARAKMLQGVQILGKAVCVTLGPKGRNVVILDPMGGKPHVTKDGVTVAKAIKLKDQEMDVAVQMIKEVSELTNDTAGDGTTTSTVLACALVEAGVKAVDDGANPMDVKRGLDHGLNYVIDQLTTHVREVTPINLSNVTAISANSDSVIGEIVAKSLNIVGTTGSISLAQSPTDESYIEERNGYLMSRGWYHSNFERLAREDVIEFTKPVVVVTTENIDANLWSLMVNSLQGVINAHLPIVIVAHDFAKEVVDSVMANNNSNVLKCVLVQAPEFAERRIELLQDLAIYTGAELWTANAVEYKPGTSDLVEIFSDRCLFVGAKGVPDEISARIAKIERQCKDPDIHAYTLNKLKERINALHGIGVKIRIGAISEVEWGEKKDRYDDAIAAGRAALKSGIVPGGGVTMLRLAESLDSLISITKNVDQKLGVQILQQSLRKPHELILKNAGLETFNIPLSELSIGVNAANGEIVDMFEAGIIDPSLVTREAMRNAVAVAGTIITTESIIFLDAGEMLSAFEHHMMK